MRAVRGMKNNAPSPGPGAEKPATVPRFPQELNQAITGKLDSGDSYVPGS